MPNIDFERKYKEKEANTNQLIAHDLAIPSSLVELLRLVFFTSVILNLIN